MHGKYRLSSEEVAGADPETGLGVLHKSPLRGVRPAAAAANSAPVQYHRCRRESKRIRELRSSRRCQEEGFVVGGSSVVALRPQTDLTMCFSSQASCRLATVSRRPPRTVDVSFTKP